MKKRKKPPSLFDAPQPVPVWDVPPVTLFALPKETLQEKRLRYLEIAALELPIKSDGSVWDNAVKIESLPFDSGFIAKDKNGDILFEGGYNDLMQLIESFIGPIKP